MDGKTHLSLSVWSHHHTLCPFQTSQVISLHCPRFSSIYQDTLDTSTIDPSFDMIRCTTHSQNRRKLLELSPSTSQDWSLKWQCLFMLNDHFNVCIKEKTKKLPPLIQPRLSLIHRLAGDGFNPSGDGFNPVGVSFQLASVAYILICYIGHLLASFTNWLSLAQEKALHWSLKCASSSPGRILYSAGPDIIHLGQTYFHYIIFVLLSYYCYAIFLVFILYSVSVSWAAVLETCC